MDKLRRQIINTLERSSKILIMPSIPVDGDSLGSALALYLALKKIGKEVTVVCADPVPELYRFLPTTKVISNDFSAMSDFIVTLDCEKAKIKTIKTRIEQDKVNIIITAKKGQFTSDEVSFHHGPSKYDLIITVDTADLEQLGRFYADNPQLFVSIPLINIDHHASNAGYGKINLIDIMASSTTEVILPLITELEQATDKALMDEDIATLLLAGIITDTGSFQNSNTSPRSFAMSAQLIKFGARQQEIIQNVFKTKHLSTLKLWGRILTKLRIDNENKIVWSAISKKDFDDTGSKEEETAGIIDELMTNAPGAELVILIKQKKENLLSGSVRTTSSAVDASAFAEIFGGGGHPRAAGFRIETHDFDESVRKVVEKAVEYQKGRLTTINSDEESDGEVLNSVIPATEETRKDTAIEPVKETHDSTAKSGKSKKAKSVEKTTQSEKQIDEETFTDVIIKRKMKEDEETEIEPGITYKFED